MDQATDQDIKDIEIRHYLGDRSRADQDIRTLLAELTRRDEEEEELKHDAELAEAERQAEAFEEAVGLTLREAQKSEVFRAALFGELDEPRDEAIQALLLAPLWRLLTDTLRATERRRVEEERRRQYNDRQRQSMMKRLLTWSKDQLMKHLAETSCVFCGGKPHAPDAPPCVEGGGVQRGIDGAPALSVIAASMTKTQIAERIVRVAYPE